MYTKSKEKMLLQLVHLVGVISKAMFTLLFSLMIYELFAFIQRNR